MPHYLKAKSGMGGTLREQLRSEAANSTNRVGRARSATTKQAFINARVQGSNMNFEGTREYTVGTLMAGSPQSAAGE